VFPEKDQAIDYAQDRASFRSAEFAFGFKRQCQVRYSVQRLELKAEMAVVRVYDEAGKVIETHDQAGEFKEP
jgi:hypothetical protein